MKISLQQFGERVTRFKVDAFVRARLKLTTLYVLIVAIILGAFSGFLYWQVEQQVETLKEAGAMSAVAVTEADAREIAERVAEGAVVEIEEEVVGGSLVYNVEVMSDGEEIDILIDQRTGEVLSGVEMEVWSDVLINDFGENLLWANGIILLLVMVLSYFLAGWSLRPVQEKLRQHEQFSADVAHELRTPLAAMLASVDAVLRTNNSVEAYQESLVDVKGETKRLIALSEGLMQTLHTGRSKNEERLDVGLIVSDTAGRLQSYSADKGVMCEVEMKSQLYTTGDRVLLERMFTNIIHNAIKFSHDKGMINITVLPNQVTITDYGVGMSDETKSKVFDRLYTADIARDERTAGGAGLGMAIVKEIADTAGIEIFIESSLGNGTCVQLTFLQ